MEYLSIGQNCFVINKCFKMYIKKALTAYDLNHTEAMVLLMIFEQAVHQEQWHPDMSENEQKPGSSGSLLEALHYNKSVMSRTVQALENKGYVQRQQNPLDGRAQILRATEKAFDIKPQLLAIFQQWSSLLLSGIDEPALFEKMMHQLACNACAGAGYQFTLHGEGNISDGKEKGR